MKGLLLHLTFIQVLHFLHLTIFMSMPLATKMHLSIILNILFGPCLPWQNQPFKQVHWFPAPWWTIVLNQFQAEFHVWLFLVGRFQPLICFCFFWCNYQLMMESPRSSTHWTPIPLKIIWLLSFRSSTHWTPLPQKISTHWTLLTMKISKPFRRILLLLFWLLQFLHLSQVMKSQTWISPSLPSLIVLLAPWHVPTQCSCWPLHAPGKTPCPSVPSSAMKSCHDDTHRESKDYDFLVSNPSAVVDITGGHIIPSFSVAVLVDMAFKEGRCSSLYIFSVSCSSLFHGSQCFQPVS